MESIVSSTVRMPPKSILLLFVCCLLAISFVIRRALAWNRLRHIPGPWPAGFTRLWLLRSVLGGDIHLDTVKLCDKYGPLVRIGPNNVLTNDPEIYREMYGVRTRYKKAGFYEAFRFDPTRDSLLSLRDNKAHHELRSKMAAGYAGKDVEGLEPQFDEQIARFVSLIERKYLSTQTEFRPADFAEKCRYLTLDVISSIAFGRDKIFGFLEKDEDVHDFIAMTETSMPIMLGLAIYPGLATLLQKPMFRSLMPSEKDRVGFGQFIKVAKDVVAERFGPKPPVRKDMVNSFLNHGLTRRELESEILVTILAGADTTAISLSATMLHLVTSPRCYAILNSEIQDGISQGRISSPITDKEGRELPYLQAVIKEGLRIHPPIAHLQTMEVPEGGETVLGKFLPGGTNISNALWSTVHDKSIFGDDADLFRPERWLEADEDQLRKMNMGCEGIFKAGKWTCLGKPLAMMNLNKAFVELLRRFDFTIVNPKTPMTSGNFGVFVLKDMWVKITRKSM